MRASARNTAIKQKSTQKKMAPSKRSLDVRIFWFFSPIRYPIKWWQAHYRRRREAISRWQGSIQAARLHCIPCWPLTPAREALQTFSIKFFEIKNIPLFSGIFFIRKLFSYGRGFLSLWSFLRWWRAPYGRRRRRQRSEWHRERSANRK